MIWVQMQENREVKKKKGEKNINIINIRMSQKYVGIANLFEGMKGGEINALKCLCHITIALK